MQMANIAVTFFVSSILATPWAWGNGNWGSKTGISAGIQNCQAQQQSCLTAADAQVGANIFRSLIQEYSDELALDALTEDFVDYASAVNILQNKGNQGPKQVNGPTFVGRQAFMDGQGSQPQIPFDTLNVFHGCDHIAMRWQTLRSGNGQKTEVSAIPVVGTAILEVVIDSDSKYGFRIRNLYSEFNTGAWMLNNGIAITTLPNNTTLPINA